MTQQHDHPLAICLALLKGFGEAGQITWVSHRDSEAFYLAKAEKEGKLTARLVHELSELRLKRLRRSILWLREKSQETGRWRRLPPDFTVFVQSDEYLKTRATLWPEVLECGAAVNSGDFTEVVLTGGIGVAKTTLAIYSQAFQQCLLACMAAPHEVFDLDPASEIATIFQSLNKNLAKDVDYQRFRNMLDAAPFFAKYFPYDTGRESDCRFPNNVIVKPVAGGDTAAIGQNVIGGIIDEVNFMAVVQQSKASKDGGLYDQAVQNYNTIARRRESRFAQMGKLPGLLCLVSSRNYPGQFTDVKEAEARTNPLIYVYDKRLWEIAPWRYSFSQNYPSEAMVKAHGDEFPEGVPLWWTLFVGDETRKPEILLRDEVTRIPVQDQHLLMEVPIEHLGAFRIDILKSLRDIAGVATQAMRPFMLNQNVIASCFGKSESILSDTKCDFRNKKVQLFKNRIKRPDEPRFAHIDLGLTRDSCGLAIGHVASFKDMDRGDLIEKLPVIQFDCTLEIQPPQAGEIEFENIRRLLYTLRANDLNIRWVSFDDFQSRDSLQILQSQGFIVGYQSMDTTMNPYETAKQAFYDARIVTPDHHRALTEFVRLEYDPIKVKCDHPPNGSKDVSDAMAGVIYGLTMRREIWQRHGVSVQQIPTSVSVRDAGNKNSIMAKEKEAEKPQGYIARARAGRYSD